MVSLHCSAFNHTITFTGSGASTTVGDVIVQNLTQGTTVTVPSGNVLTLTVATALEQVSANEEFICVYPSSSDGKSTVSFFAKQAGVTQINSFSIDGRKMAGITENLQAGINSFQLSLPGGFFVIRVSGNGYSYTTKMINQGATFINPAIAYLGTERPIFSNLQKSEKYEPGTIKMAYTNGDQLLYKAFSGNYCTIVTDKPSVNKTTNFEFVACTDADGTNYTTVTIGSQTWMADNLKTTKYRNGDSIPVVTGNTTWSNLVTDACCNYNNDAANIPKTGKLYNWYAANNARNIAPLNWHVPTDAEWTKLTTFLGGISAAGGKLKETGNVNWLSTDNATTNETGFSALPGGFRQVDGTFDDISLGGNWWSSSEDNTTNAWFRDMTYNSSTTDRSSENKVKGFSVRCVKDIVYNDNVIADPSLVKYVCTNSIATKPGVLKLLTIGTTGVAQTRGYAEYVPSNYASEKNWPCIINLHGDGEFGDGKTEAGLMLFTYSCLTGMISVDKWDKDHRFVVLSPQFSSYDDRSATNVKTFIQYAKANYNIDVNRIYMTAVSGGGVALGNYLDTYSGGEAAAIFPVSCYVPPTSSAKWKSVPVWFLCGAADNTVDPANILKNYNAIMAVPPTVVPKITLYTGVGHDINSANKSYSPETMDNKFETTYGGISLVPYSNVYDWLLQYHK